MGELKRILDGRGADGWPLDGIPGWVLSYLAPLNAKARGERLTELHAALLDAAPASAPPASAYASPIREPEISRTDLIKLLADHFGFRPYEQMAEDKSDLRGKVRDGYDVNEPTKSDLAEVADAILNLAPVGGRGEGWRPIETAPKDALLLLWGTLEPHPEDKDLYANLDVPRRVVGSWCDIDEAWSVAGSTWLGPWFKPTHWRPLPPPPEEQKEGSSRADLSSASRSQDQHSAGTLHPATADLVGRFTIALRDKLAAAEAKYGLSLINI